MKRQLLAGLLVFALALITVAAVASDEVMFAYNFADGHSQKYMVKFSQEVDAGFFTMNIFADMEVTEEFLGKNEDGRFMMRMTFNTVEASRMMGGNMADSKISENLTGKAVVYLVDSNGKVDDLKVDGHIEGWGQVKDIIEPIVESGYPYFPNAAIAIGKSWAPDDEVEKSEEGLEVATTGEFVFKEIKDEAGRKCALVKGALELSMGGTMMSPQGAGTAEGGGKGKYEYLFDAGSGLIVKIKGNMDVNITVEADSGEDPFQVLVGYSMERTMK